MGQEPWLTYLTNIQYTDESRPIVESTSLVQDCVGQGRVSERLLGCKEILLESHSESLLDTVGSEWVRSRARVINYLVRRPDRFIKTITGHDLAGKLLLTA